MLLGGNQAAKQRPISVLKETSSNGYNENQARILGHGNGFVYHYARRAILIL